MKEILAERENSLISAQLEVQTIVEKHNQCKEATESIRQNIEDLQKLNAKSQENSQIELTKNNNLPYVNKNKFGNWVQTFRKISEDKEMLAYKHINLEFNFMSSAIVTVITISDYEIEIELKKYKEFE